MSASRVSPCPCLYAGQVTHVRTRPRRHRLRYGVFSLLIDIDAPAPSGLRLFGRNRFAAVSFHDADHGDGDGDLSGWARRLLGEAGVPVVGVCIEALCFPRIFGYAFNPLTVFFCRSQHGDLVALLYEVSNTMGERHTYVAPVQAGEIDAASGVVRQRCNKDFYVSPFIGMECAYAFRVQPPDEKMRLEITETDAEGPFLAAVQSGVRKPLNDRTLAWMLASHPLMTMKVTLGIYWEALRIWLKKVPIHSHIAAPTAYGHTIVSSSPEGKDAHEHP